MIILVLIIHECYYSCLVFLFTGKFNQILAPLATPGLRLDLQTGHVKVVKKTKCDVTDNNFYGFITINNVSIQFFNWKIAEIIFVSVIDYY